MKKSNVNKFAVLQDVCFVTRLYFKTAPKKSTVYLLLKIVSLLIESAFSIMIVIFPKYFVDALTEARSIELAIKILLIYCVIRLSASTVGNIVLFKSNIIIADINKKIEEIILVKASNIPYEQFEEPDYYDKYNKALEYVRGGSDVIIAIFFEFCQTLISFIAASAVIGQLNIFVLMALFMLLVVKYVVRKRIDKAIIKIREDLVRINRKNGYLVSILSNKDQVRDLKMNRGIDFLCSKFRMQYYDSREKQEVLTRKRILFGIPSSIVEILFVSVLYLSLGLDLYGQSITLGEYSAALSAALLLSNYIQLLLNNISSFRTYHYGVTCFLDFMNYELPVSPPFPEKDIKSIVFDHVSYKYPGQDVYAIKNVSFTVSEGEKIALVGQNGAGKTTIVNLMLGLLRPAEGAIKINGVDIKDYQLDELYDHIAVVFQNHCEYAFTIGENVLMNSCDSEEDIENVNASLKKAHLFNKVIAMKKGIHTSLTRTFDDEGVDLSGGEHQKIAISRAFAKNADFIIMDEPTSSLDAIAEYEICGDLINLSEKRTVIIISHRLSSILDSDRIVVVDSGSVVESGTHQELMKKDGLYARMFNLQNNK